MEDPDFSTFTLMPKGNRFEDFKDRQSFEHHWGRTITEADNALFATTTLRYTPLYFNAECAQADGHPSVVIDPLLALCMLVGLSVEDLSESGGPFLGVNNVVFHRPIYPGDTLNARSTVVDRRLSKSRPEFGIVTWRSEGHNQRGELIVSYERTNLVARRPEGEEASGDV